MTMRCEPTLAYERFPDLYQSLDPEDFVQVRPLLFGKKEIQSNVNRKAFQKEAEALAKSFAKESRNEEIMELQRHIDEEGCLECCSLSDEHLDEGPEPLLAS